MLEWHTGSEQEKVHAKSACRRLLFTLAAAAKERQAADAAGGAYRHGQGQQRDHRQQGRDDVREHSNEQRSNRLNDGMDQERDDLEDSQRLRAPC